MGHTNSTPNYNLPQFLTTDKPAWLTDINGAFSAIDSAVHTAQTDATTAGTNASQALLDASAASTAASTADSKASGAIASIADAFDATATYALGDLVIYNSLLYICTVAVITPGAWTGSANWTRTTAETQLARVLSELKQFEYTDHASGVWRWREYADGTVELWGEEDSTYSGSFNAWGAIFSLDVAGLGSYPVTFTRIDELHGGCGLGGANAASSLTNYSDTASLGSAPGYTMIRGNNIGAGDRNLYKSLYVRGSIV